MYLKIFAWRYNKYEYFRYFMCNRCSKMEVVAVQKDQYCHKLRFQLLCILHSDTFTASQRSYGKVIFSEVSVVLSTGGRGSPLWTETLWTQTPWIQPPGYRSPSGQRFHGQRPPLDIEPLPDRDPLGQRPLLDRYTPDWHLVVAIEAGGTHPTGMYTC